MSPNPDILLVSKPIVPPWNDSGKNLVRDLAAHAGHYQYRVLATPGTTPPGPNAIAEPLYSNAGRFAPAVANQLAVVRRLLMGKRAPLTHFFFAPNPLTSTVMRLLKPALMGSATVHTVTSRPKSYDGVKWLLFADKVVVLSKHTASMFRNAGVEDIIVIPPSVPITPRIEPERKSAILSTLNLPEDKPLVLFAGDYSFGTAHHRMLQALPRILADTDCHMVFAVRTKTEESRGQEESIKQTVSAAGWDNRVSFHNEIDDMEALAAAVTLNVLPADTLYAKMDFPLVLLESMREEVPVVVSDHGPLPELVEGGGGMVAPLETSGALEERVCELLQSPDKRLEMGKLARQTVLQRFHPKVMAMAYELLYDELLGAGDKR